MKRVDVAYVLLYDEQENKVLMVKNKGEQSSYYTLPGGAVEPGETLVEGAIREVKEETGLEVEVNGIVGIHEAFFKARGHHAVFFHFRGKWIGGEIEISYPDEIEEVVWMDLELAQKYIGIPETKDLLKKNTSISYINKGII